MVVDDTMRDAVAALNASAAFNRQVGFEVVSAGSGAAELRLPWREDLGQYAGFLHAAMIGGMNRHRLRLRPPSPSSATCWRRTSPSIAWRRPRATRSWRAPASSRPAGARCSCAPICSRSRATDERLVATGDAILVPVGTPA